MRRADGTKKHILRNLLWFVGGQKSNKESCGRHGPALVLGRSIIVMWRLCGAITEGGSLKGIIWLQEVDAVGRGCGQYAVDSRQRQFDYNDDGNKKQTNNL
jgi:hypothetical protein